MDEITSLASANQVMCTDPLSISAMCISALSFLFGDITDCSNTCFANKKKQDVFIFAHAQKEIQDRATKAAVTE